MGTPDPDTSAPVHLSRQVFEASKGACHPKLLGGVAVYFSCPIAQQAPFARTYNDIDLAIPTSERRALTRVFESLGLEADRRFNALNGATRMLFYHASMPVDVFVGTFEQCHKLPLETAFKEVGISLPPQHLLLTKLQVVQLTEKDIVDASAILLDHFENVTATDIPFLMALCARDWGWYTTVTDTLDKIVSWNATEPLGEHSSRLVPILERLRDWLETSPKTLTWKARARVGRRVPWYELPEDKSR